MRSIIPPAARLRLTVAVVAAVLSPVANAGEPAPKPQLRPKPEPLVIKVDDGGFRWSDAGIGAAAGFGAALVLAGGLALAGRDDRVMTRPRQPEEEQQ